MVEYSRDHQIVISKFPMSKFFLSTVIARSVQQLSTIRFLGPLLVMSQSNLDCGIN